MNKKEYFKRFLMKTNTVSRKLPKANHTIIKREWKLKIYQMTD